MYKRHFNNSRPWAKNSFSRRRIKTVDVSLLVKKADDNPVAQDTVIKHRFSEFSISEDLQRNILEKGYTLPKPIQDEVIPLVLQGKDVVGIANTGTGKTAAFLIPLINKIIYSRNQRVLIVTPTRELAVQIKDELKLFTRGLNIFSVLCIGGVSMHQQVGGLKRFPHVVIGTPGRLKDLKEQGKLNIASFDNFVLDEVDRMLDMGFINDIRFLISQLPRVRQSLFFSATVSPSVKNIINTISQNPTFVSVKVQETLSNTDQDIIKINGQSKIDVLHNLLAKEEFTKVIVFGRTKWGVEKLSKQLEERGLDVVALHGNKNQNQRQRALDQFRNNEVRILLTTDVVARGIDVDDVSHVINFDLPETYEDYVHRIGRTGRNNKKGVALSFVD